MSDHKITLQVSMTQVDDRLWSGTYTMIDYTKGQKVSGETRYQDCAQKVVSEAYTLGKINIHLNRGETI